MEIKKYISRFGWTISIAAAALLITQGPNALKIIGYKIALVTIAVALCEFVWLIFFKKAYGKSEEMGDGFKTVGIFIFRGMLYGAVILALTLGL